MEAAANFSDLILLKGGRVIDPARERDETADLLIANGRIAEIGRVAPPAGASVVDVAGLVVAPGLVDMHVHLREPGFEYKETIAGGTRAAAAGGVTAVAAMPNTNPVADDPSVITFIRERAARAGVVNVLPIGAITKGLAGEMITEIGLLQQAGCVAFSDDGRAVVDSGVMRRAMDYAKVFDALIIQHAEDPGLAGRGCMHEGVISSRLGLPGIPGVAETVMVERDLRLAALTGCRYHVAHISTASAVAAVAAARSRGVRASCEAAPHHFTLTDAAVGDYDTNAKMAPPLRSGEDRQALLEGLARGVITVIATDHAPHDQDSKQVEFCHASNGVVGLETMLPLALELVREGVFDLSRCLAAMTCNPARLLGWRGGTLEVGSPADVVVFDPAAAWIVDAARLQGAGRNTCFHGRQVTGRVRLTLVNGRAVWREGL